MKSLLCAVLQSLAFLLLIDAGVGNAQMISWSPAVDLKDSSDVVQNGTFIDAVTNFTINGDSPKIGDTTFHDLSGALTDGTITFAHDNTANHSAFPTTDSTYQDLIGYGGYTNHGETGTISFVGLTPTDTYQIQVFAWYTDNGFDPTLSDNDHGTPITLLINPGQYTLGTFTASASTFSFNYDVGSEGGGVINAIALREIPEPSAWLLLGTGAMALIWQARRAARA